MACSLRRRRSVMNLNAVAVVGAVAVALALIWTLIFGVVIS